MNSVGSGPELMIQSPKVKVIEVNLGNRRQVQRRLQELSINVWCSDFGHLQAEVQNDADLLQINSVTRQFKSSRLELVSWLEQCWQWEN